MIATVTLYHNPRCAKSRAAWLLLQVRHVHTHVVDYQTYPLSMAQLRVLMQQLGVHSPRQMMRCNDALYTELNLDQADDEALLAALAAHPKLLERPIAVLGDKAAIGRPLSNIETLLQEG